MNDASELVSVILVNYKGADDTLEAIRHLGDLDWPQERLEIVVVDNASEDDSGKRIRKEAPHVKLVNSRVNLGFAGGCNLGVRKSRGSIIAFLNNDARPDPKWLTTAVGRLEESSTIGAIASRVLDWDGKLVDFIDAGLTWFGMGYKPHAGFPQPEWANQPRDVLFGTGSAMLVRREIYLELGGFDERYFMFFEDVDFGWRLNLKGYRFVYEPKSLVYHRHHASMQKLGAFKETYLLERNALFTLYKNIGDDAFGERLAASLLLAVRRAVSRSTLDSTSLDIRKSYGDETAIASVPKDALATLYALDQFVQELPALVRARDEVQSLRVVPEHVIYRLFRQTNAPSFEGEDFMKGYQNITQAFDVLSEPNRTRVLVITGDPVGDKMAGPAIRAWHIAMELSQENDVRLISLVGHEGSSQGFTVDTVLPGNDKEMSIHEEWADVIVFQGLAMALFPSIRNSKKIMIIDIYDPMHLEQLEQARQPDEEAWYAATKSAAKVLNQQLARGDFFLCASERQRHFYLGQLSALGRLNPANYLEKPDLTGLITVVPFGLEADPPVHERPVLKGVIPGIEEQDKVLLWSGGIYNWFDPLLLIRAVADISTRHPEVRLFFLGTRHPNPGVPEMKVVTEARGLAAELGVEGKNVFFNDSWVDYRSRGDYLAEADLGVSTHHAHIETTFSFRTRILDYLWASVPMVVTEGDHFAEIVASKGLGEVVPANDLDSLIVAIEKMLFEKGVLERARTRIDDFRLEYEWSRVLSPVVEFVRHAKPAADRLRLGSAPNDSRGNGLVSNRKHVHGKDSMLEDLRRAWLLLLRRGPKAVMLKVRQRIAR